MEYDTEIIFVDSDGEEIISDEETVEEDETPLEKAIRTKKVTHKILLETEITEILRTAYSNEYLKNEVYRYLRFRPLPVGENVTLYPHQVSAISFMQQREKISSSLVHGLKGGIIHLQMGLGKSLLAATHSLISPRPPYPEKYGEGGFPTLIIASKTLMLEWKKQCFEKFFGDRVSVLYLHKDFLGNKINTVTRQNIVQFDFVVTTYDVCNKVCNKYEYHRDVLEMGDDHSLMKGKVVAIHNRLRHQSDKPHVKGEQIIYTTPWERVIVDESQRFCNPSTKTYRYMMAVYGKYKWCLTGTPVKNYVTDAWAQLRFCGYNGITTAIMWKRYGVMKMRDHHLNQAILSMTYDSVGIKLPNKYQFTMHVTLDGNEKLCYDTLLGVAQNQYDMMMRGLCDFASVLALFTRLRQCAIAPYLITKESKREKGLIISITKEKEAIDKLKEIYKGTLGAWVYDKYGTSGINSKKMQQIITTLERIPEPEKVLIFSMFTSVLDLLALAIKEKIPYFEFVQVDGDTKGIQREELLHRFRTDVAIRGCLLTYKVGSEGLNLIEATHVICIEPWWTSTVKRQAEGRSHRLGQTKEIETHDIYVRDSIEDRIIEICKEKEKMEALILEGSEHKINTGIDKYTLGRMLGLR